MSTYIDWMRSCWYISFMSNPAISVPAGFTSSGLPVGIQIVGRHNGELSLLQLAHAFEQATGMGRSAQAHRQPDVWIRKHTDVLAKLILIACTFRGAVVVRDRVLARCCNDARWLREPDTRPDPLRERNEQGHVGDRHSILRGRTLGRSHTNPNVKLKLDRDPALPDQPVLLVEYPASTGNPAERDIWCDAQNVDWTSGRAISFQVKPDHALRLSVSFLDRNRVAYTSWTELQGAAWQTVRISFDQIRPNPYFQPPGAKTGAPIDVSEVTRIGFAPQHQAAGRLAISRFVVVD